MDRQRLYDRINLRVDNMIKAGLIQEVKSLLSRGYTKDLVSMQGLGYKEMISYLRGLSTLDETLSILKRDTRIFAKLHLTCFRREDRMLWLNRDKFNDSSSMTKWLINGC